MVWYGPCWLVAGFVLLFGAVVLLTSVSGWEGYVGGVLAVDVAWAFGLGDVGGWAFFADGFVFCVGCLCWGLFVCGSRLGSADEPESLILAQSERWRHA